MPAATKVKILYLNHYKVVFIAIKKKLAYQSTNNVPLIIIKIDIYLEYTILELKLLSTAVALYRAFYILAL